MNCGISVVANQAAIWIIGYKRNERSMNGINDGSKKIEL